MTDIHDKARVLVTGGAGFIGSVLVGTMLQAGCEVTVVEAVPRERAWRLAGLDRDGRLDYRTVDILDREAVSEAVTGHDVVFHLASNTENRADLAAPDADFRVTAGGTVTLLNALSADPPGVVVLASSQLVYGDLQGDIDETTCPAGPTSKFAAGKAAAESFLAAFAHEHGIRSAACRLSNIVGGSMRRGIVFDLVTRLTEDPCRVQVLGDGRQRRNFLHVDDCATALAAVAAARWDGFTVFNVCNDDVTEIAEVAQIVADEWPSGNPEILFRGGTVGWKGDLSTLRVVPRRLTEIGWRPRLASSQAVRTAVSDMLTAADHHSAV
jgi:UDP-glucose 4-epimerase